jgi:hypothetical protein
LEARRIWMHKIFRREAAVVMCYGDGKEPSLPSL